LVIILPMRTLRRATVRGRKTRSIWTGVPILNMTVNARCEAMLGVDSRSLVTRTFFISSVFDYNLTRWCGLPVIGRLVPYAALLWISATADRVHAFCDGGVLPPARHATFNAFELSVYKALGIDLFLWTYGADVRSRETTLTLGEPNCCTDCALIGVACICDETRRRANIATLAQHARAIFSMGDMIEYTPGSRNDLFFWPVDLDADGGRRYAPLYPEPHPGRPIRIVHAPNHRMFKGTRFLEDAVASLRAEGVAVELVLVERVPNEKALEIYRTADIVFDQCLVGFHGYFALESLALGKPVMCFIRKPREYLIAPDECPIVNVHAGTLREDIRRLVAESDRLGDLGRRGRAYIEKYFALPAFAERLRRAYAELGVSP
jgi:hypothetical protein